MTIITQNECLSADQVENYIGMPTALMLHLKSCNCPSSVQSVLREWFVSLFREDLPCWSREAIPFHLRVSRPVGVLDCFWIALTLFGVKVPAGTWRGMMGR